MTCIPGAVNREARLPAWNDSEDGYVFAAAMDLQRSFYYMYNCCRSLCIMLCISFLIDSLCRVWCSTTGIRLWRYDMSVDTCQPGFVPPPASLRPRCTPCSPGYVAKYGDTSVLGGASRRVILV
jgi:hypothetical protein